MPEHNGNCNWEENLRLLNEAARLNIEEHERIWKAIDTLRVTVLETNTGIGNLTSAIRALIDRIPPENLH